MTDNELAARALYEYRGADWLIERADPAYTDALLSCILQRVHPGERILDICCGYGRMTLPLRAHGFHVTGVDISDVLLRKGLTLLRQAEHGPSPFVVGNLKKLPVISEAFDFAFCVWASFNFLTTETDQLQALTEMRRILKRGGTALIEGPLHETAAAVQVVSSPRVTYQYAPWTIDEMDILARRVGFNCTATVQSMAGRMRALIFLHKR